MRASRLVGAAALTAGGVIAAAGARLRPLPLPVTVDLQGLGSSGVAGRTSFGAVAGRTAFVVPVAAAGLGLLLGGRRAASRTGLAVLNGAASPITVLLVAQTNGVSDLGALVLTYASTAGGVLVRSLQGRDRGDRPRELPLRFASMIAVVPWGVIALHQVGADLAGRHPAPAVRVLTNAVLAASAAEFVASWRGRRRSPEPSAAETVLVVAPPLLLAGLGILVRR